jgi:hypothetical protein
MNKQFGAGIPVARRNALGLLVPLLLLATLLLGPLLPGMAGPVPDEGDVAPKPLLCNPGAGEVGALGAGTISISPVVAYTTVGSSVSVDVWISDVTDLYGMDFRICFDPNIAAIPSNDGTLLWEVFDPVNNFQIRNGVFDAYAMYCPCTSIPTNKFYWYSVTQTDDPFNPGTPLPFSGSGRLARLTFQGMAVGTTALHFCYAKGSTKDGDPLWPTMVDGSITVSEPTAVQLLWFDAESAKMGIKLSWETASEATNLGFNLYRATWIDGKRTKINAELIYGQVPPGSSVGAIYEYTDKTVRGRLLYYYWLEAVDIYGLTQLHGPVAGKAP